MKGTTGKTKGVYLLAGSDHYEVQKAALTRNAQLAPEDPLNHEVIDAQVDSAADALRQIAELKAAVLTLPFFGGSKLIWWKNVNFLADDGLGRNAAIIEALEAILPVLQSVDGAEVTLLISALGVDRRRAFFKQLSKFADLRAFDLADARKFDAEQVVDLVERKLAEARITVEAGVAERLAQAFGLEMRALDQAIEKLVTFAGEGNRVTMDEARLLVRGNKDAVIWDFCDAVLRGQPRQALQELDQLLQQGESEIGILVLLSQQIRLAALAAVLLENRLLRLVPKGNFTSAEVKPEAEIYLPRKKSGETVNLWQLGQVAQKSKNRPARFWLQSLEKLHSTYRQLITGAADKEQALQVMTLELAAGQD